MPCVRVAVPIPPSRQNPETLIVVAPALLSLADSLLAKSAPLARLMTLDAGPIIEPAGIDAAIAAAAGYRGALAPLTALGAGLDPADDWVLYADPVHIEIGATDALVAGRVDNLDTDEAHALAADINGLVGREGPRIAVARAERWLALSRDDVAGEAVPLDAVVGRSLAASLRRDDAGRAWARLRGEIEMLLHEHPINRARDERGAVSVDSLWLWGGGRRSMSLDDLPVVVDAYPGRAGDLARGLAIASRGRIVASNGDGVAVLVEEMTSLAAAGSRAVAIVVASPIATESRLEAFGRDVLAAGLVSLDARRIGELVLVADGAGHAMTWRAHRPSALRRLELALRAPRFVRR